MNLDIVIPTINRREKLINCLNSIFLSTRHIPVNLYIYFSIQEELDYIHSLIGFIEGIKLKMVQNYRVPSFWNAHLKEMKSDAMMYLNDDVMLFDNTVSLVIEEFEKKFPDYDGVMGLSQANLPEADTLEGAFGIVGTKFADRFPDRQAICPDYYRFYSDKELWLYSTEIGKFHYDTEIKIKHFHAAYYKDALDETHINVRKHLARDKYTYNQRQTKNLLWGRNFDLINEEEHNVETQKIQ